MELTNELRNRKGRVKLPRSFVLESNELMLKEFFSNFFPVDIENDYMSYMEGIIFYGISPHFELQEPACIAPFYEFMFTTHENGIVEFQKVIKL